MDECICNSCKNLKMSIDDAGEAGEYVCKFGYPSDRCEICQEDGCEETCLHYISDEEEDIPVTVKCKACGKELQAVMEDGNENEVFCVDCYLNKHT